MVADICVASDRATFRVPELLRGLVDSTYAALLRAHVGIAAARNLLLTARWFDAEEAVRMGLIARMVAHDQLREAAVKAVGEILQTGPIARAHVKRMLNDPYELIDYQTVFNSLAESPEPREGMSAFMEKRPPNWCRSSSVATAYGGDGGRAETPADAYASPRLRSIFSISATSSSSLRII
jgi:enoyl-CoA hydratase